MSIENRTKVRNVSTAVEDGIDPDVAKDKAKKTKAAMHDAYDRFNVTDEDERGIAEAIALYVARQASNVVAKLVDEGCPIDHARAIVAAACVAAGGALEHAVFQLDVEDENGKLVNVHHDAPVGGVTNPPAPLVNGDGKVNA